jgi:hypothetical protein
MESAGWIKRGEDVEHSRFWRLIQGERAEMFGVFSSYEQQVLRDWIQTPRDADATVAHHARAEPPRAPAHPRQPGQHADRSGYFPERGLIRRHAAGAIRSDNRTALLEERVAAAAGKAEAMALLARADDAGRAPHGAGLMATRMYSQLLDA